VHDLVELLDHVHRDADGPALVGDRARHGLANPPRGVRGELVAAAVVELLDGADEAQRTLLDQVQERQAAAEVALGDRDDQPQVGLDHRLLGGHVAALDALGERHLLLGGQQRDAADRPQVEPQRVQRRLDGEVDLRLLAGFGRRRWRLALGGDGFGAAALGRDGLAVRRDDRDPLLIEMRVELRQLLLRDLDLFERGGDLLDGEEPALLPFVDERSELVELRDGCLVSKQNVGLGAQPDPCGRRSRRRHPRAFLPLSSLYC
jgi:hypothetical protein